MAAAVPIHLAQENDILPGAQFSVYGIVTGIGGVPYHLTPVWTVSSSALNHVKDQDTHKQVLMPQLTATHSCTWDRGNKLVLPVRYR